MLNLPILWSSSTSYLAGLTFGFYFNKKFTFQSTKENSDIFYKYFFVYFSNLIISLALLDFLVSRVFLHPALAQLAAISYTTLANYAGLKTLIFESNILKLNWRKILTNKFLIGGLFLRVLLILAFEESLQNLSHFQFINSFIQTGLNPYESYLNRQSLTVFPYPALMLYIFTLPAYCINFIYSFLQIESFYLLSHMGIIIFSDLVICKVLMDWAPEKKKQVLLFYWLSPVVLYLGYFIGQIDVVPTALLLLSLRFLIQGNIFKASAFIGAALSTKLSTVLALPFMIFYVIFQDIKLRFKLLIIFLPLTLFFLVNFQFLADYSFLELVLKNPYQFNIFNFSLNYDHNLKFYLIPAFYAFLVIQASILKIRSGSILMMFLGLSFGIIMLFIKPMPGWYYWLLVFLIYFCITFPHERRRDFILLATLQLTYFIYFFMFSTESAAAQPYVKISNLYYFQQIANNYWLKNISFTLLQTTLSFSLGWIFFNGLREYFKNKMASRPFFIGIGGNSGTGKSTLAESLADLFGEQKTTLICGDDSHRWERGHQKWTEFTHLNPKANDIQNEYKFLWSLRHRKTTERRFYDHDTGKFTYNESSKIRAKNVVIYEGLHPFYMEKVREIFDLKIFLKPDEKLSTQWKINRDTVKRGYSIEKILTQIQNRKNDYEQYIETQEKHADVIIQLCTNPENSKATTREDLYLKITCSTNVFLDRLVNVLESFKELSIEHLFQNDKQIIIIKGKLDSEDISLAAQNAIQLQNININAPKWMSGINGLLQLVCAFFISEYVHEH